MKRALIALATTLALSACGTSGFEKATEANSTRDTVFLEAMLTQATNDLLAINDCYTRAKTSDSMAWALCVNQSTALRLTSTFLTFMARPQHQRVPDSPEEIMRDLIKFGIPWAVGAWGLGKWTDMVTTGQLAQQQLAQTAIDAAAKPPMQVNPILLETGPSGTRVIPLPTN